MVRVTVFVEGKTEPHDLLALDDNLGLREAFHRLFSQSIDSRVLDIQIEPIGSICHAARILESSHFGADDVMLIDLDGPEMMRPKRLADNFSNPRIDQSRIFFMVQMTEGWILSQPDALDRFGIENGYLRKREEEEIATNRLIKGKKAWEIEKPDKVLDTLLRQYFDEKRNWKGKTKLKGKIYSKKKDAPDMIVQLSFARLRGDFLDVSRIDNHFKSKMS